MQPAMPQMNGCFLDDSHCWGGASAAPLGTGRWERDSEQGDMTARCALPARCDGTVRYSNTTILAGCQRCWVCKLHVLPRT